MKEKMPCPDYPKKTTKILDEHTEKGCLHWVDIGGDSSISSQKARPYIIIGRNNPKSNRIIMCPVSDIIHYLENGSDKLKYPYHAPLYKKQYSFLDKDSAILLDQVYTIAKNELCEEWYIGKVVDLTEIDKAIMYNYDLFESIYEAYAELLKQLPKVHVSQYTRK
ncbi:MAG: type II toxin-antitoxin system PemK/MazF family toxin [Clostridia bacterium]|nr:type II toxin-antitoxin system PemK/MazF family toxin [Clostridia bacterium]